MATAKNILGLLLTNNTEGNHGISLGLLLKKHSKDFVCVPECKTGASLSAKYRTMDLWCMAKSWTKPKTIAYEIKISRNDFLRDDKWRAYLEYCSEFYFAAPPGIIEPSELPFEAGLLVCSKNARLMYTKKKAPERSVKIPESIFRYILKWRANVHRESPADHTQFWQEWLHKKEDKRDLGYSVSRAIRQHVQKVNLENTRLKRENESLQKTKEALDKLGFRLRDMNWDAEDKLKQRIREINTGISMDVLKSIDHAIYALTKTQEALRG